MIDNKVHCEEIIQQNLIKILKRVQKDHEIMFYTWMGGCNLMK